MSTLNIGETNIFTDLGKVIEGTLLTNTYPMNVATNAYSLTLTKGTWLLVFTFRCDQASTSYRTFAGFTGSPSQVGGVTSDLVAINYKTVTTATETVYATIWPESYTFTWTSGSRKCFAVKIA